MSETKAAEAAQKVREQFSEKALQQVSFHGEESVVVRFDALYDVLKWCKESLGFTMLLDLIGIDHLGEEERFELSYVLTRPEEGTNLLIRASLPGTDAPSVVDLWAAANWNEREVFDLMGIRFLNHPDLRRLLMWDEYPFHPLRKDFPLAGIPVETPNVAEADAAPWEGGPFYSQPASSSVEREPHSRESL